MQTTSYKEIREFVLDTITKDMNYPLDLDEVTDDSPLGADGIDLDSLSLIELTLRIGGRFGVQFPDTDIEPIGAMKLSELVDDVIARSSAA
jgi:acyl carrier protein